MADAKEISVNWSSSKKPMVCRGMALELLYAIDVFLAVSGNGPWRWRR
jgi:hypothetical protein